LGPGGVRVLLALFAIGLAVRLYFAFRYYGVTYDIDSLVAVDGALGSDPLQVYSTVNGHPYNRWPYPSGFFPFIGLAHGLGKVFGDYHDWVQVPQILADLAIDGRTAHDIELFSPARFGIKP